MILENVKIYWCKLLGEPQPGYEGVGKEWSVEFGLDEATVDGQPAADALKAAGVGSRLKSDEAKGTYIRFKKNAILKDGSRAKNIPVVDGQNKPWSGGLIGNESIGAANVMLDEYGDGKKKKISAKLMSMQVSQLVPYVGKSPFENKGETVTKEANSDW